MNIAIIGTGNVGSALASAWSRAGHTISLGVREKSSFKGKELLKNKNTSLHSIIDAVQKSDVILISTPAMNAVEVAKSLAVCAEVLAANVSDLLVVAIARLLVAVS